MALHLKIQAEPFTDYSKGREPILAKSEEFRRLRHDLERYTNGQIQGRSYLIAGHRGSGKTMMVHNAIEDLLRSSLTGEYRPLFVRLHGPDLLPPIGRVVQKPGEQADKKIPAEALPPRKEATQSAASSETTPQIPPAIVPKPPAVTKPSAVSDEVKQHAKADKELETVLTEMVKALYRDVTNEYRRCYREAILRLDSGLPRDELLEVAAQFDYELTDYVTLARLRTFWHRLDAFRRGILFNTERSKYKLYTPAKAEQPSVLEATDIGLQEILVLSFLSEAFRVTSGTIEDVQRRTEAEKGARSSSLNTAYELKNLFAPLAGLLSGGLVGIAIGSTNPFAAVLLGLLTGAVVSFGFSYKSERSQSKETSLESVFKKDRSVPTLSSVLPLLVVRLKQIGLAPVFVIDELDKVPDLKERMRNLVRHLKFLVTENSFSCFLTDRRYLTYLNRQAEQTAYAPEYTYFSDRLLVLYSPVELRDFVREVLEPFPSNPTVTNDTLGQAPTAKSADEKEIEKIAYVWLYRARMHPIDLRRQIDSLTARESFSMAECFALPRSRFEILMQVAIEWVLDGEDVQIRLSGNPYYRQVVYDALYYVSRLWEDAGADKPQVPGFKDFGSSLDEKKPGLVLDEQTFADYIESRSAVEDKVEPPEKVGTSADAEPRPNRQRRKAGKDSEFLFGKVRELLSYLCKPEYLIDEINRSQRKTKPYDFILQEIPKDETLRLMIKEKDKPNYRWLYDVSGRYLQTRDVDFIIADVADAITYIREFMAGLDQLGVAGGLQTLAEANLIPRPSQWKAVVQPALDRLDRLGAEKEPYGNMNAHRDAVVEFEGTLNEFEPNLKAALLSAAVFAPEVSLPVPSPGANYTAALREVCRILQPSAQAEEDLRKLSLLLNSTPALDVTFNDELATVVDFVARMMQGKPASSTRSEEIINSAWEKAKIRFGKRFQDGTVRFDVLFEDVFSSFKKLGPGHELGADFSTITASIWTTLLLRSITEDKVPAWLRVAASIELGMLDLADRLSKTVHDDAMLSQWVGEVKRNALAQATRRRSIFVVAVEPKSLTEGWKPSTRHEAVVATAPDFGRLIEDLKSCKVALVADFPVDLVAIELVGDPQQLGRWVTMRPQSALAEMGSGKGGSISRELDPLLNSSDFCYIVNELPMSPPSNAPAPRFIVAPKGLDDLIDHFPGNVSTSS